MSCLYRWFWSQSNTCLMLSHPPSTTDPHPSSQIILAFFNIDLAHDKNMQYPSSWSALPHWHADLQYHTFPCKWHHLGLLDARAKVVPCIVSRLKTNPV